ETPLTHTLDKASANTRIGQPRAPDVWQPSPRNQRQPGQRHSSSRSQLGLNDSSYSVAGARGAVARPQPRQSTGCLRTHKQARGESLQARTAASLRLRLLQRPSRSRNRPPSPGA
ncbi:unnamed protein product, partial [Ectocarpus fasciculatus]